MSGSGDDKKIENTNLFNGGVIMKNVMMFSLMVMLMVGVSAQADIVLTLGDGSVSQSTSVGDAVVIE